MHKVGKDDRAMYQCVVTSRHHNMQAAAQLALGGGYGVGEVGAGWAKWVRGGRGGRRVGGRGGSPITRRSCLRAQLLFLQLILFPCIIFRVRLMTLIALFLSCALS